MQPHQATKRTMTRNIGALSPATPHCQPDSVVWRDIVRFMSRLFCWFGAGMLRDIIQSVSRFRSSRHGRDLGVVAL